MAIVLIGPPAAGKSKIGRNLARLLEREFIDTDKEVEALYGPIPEIFASRGEPAFREYERQAVVEALTHDAVVSTGGGAVLDENTQADLAQHTVVLLQATADDVAERIRPGGKRPLAPDLEAWKALVAARAPLYERLADIRVTTSSRPRVQIAEELAEQLRQRLPDLPRSSAPGPGVPGSNAPALSALQGTSAPGLSVPGSTASGLGAPQGESVPEATR